MTIILKIKTDTALSDSNLTINSLSKKFNLNTRISYYKTINKYIKSQIQYDPHNCFRYENGVFGIGNRIILDKKIGTASSYGVVFLSHYLNNKKKLTFATKILDSSKRYNIIETNVLEFLTNINIKSKVCPHFPITYGTLRCNDKISIPYTKQMLSDLYYKDLIFIFNELADGDLYSIIKNRDLPLHIAINAFLQIFMAVMFFNKYVQAFHRDSHAGNFLYHKIKPGGYFHYRINETDYFIENIGYLWVIWDFGLIVPFKDFNYLTDEKLIYNVKLPINYDYMLVLTKAFKYIRFNDNIIDTIVKFNNVYDIDKMPILVSEILNLLTKYTNGNFLTSLPSNSKIINKIAYKY